MKSETQNLKDGQWRVTPESIDDVWVLSSIIEAGDRCTAVTTRKIAVGESGAERKTVVLTLDVEKVAMEGDALRVLGVVRDGTQDVPSGEHHSFVLMPGTSITIVKQQWGHDQVQRLRQACDVQPPAVLVVVFDREEANLALLRRGGYQLLLHLTGTVHKKRMVEKIAKSFFDELAEVIRQYDERFHPVSIVLGSPAFWKEEFLPFLDGNVRKKVVLATSSGGHEQAIGEVLRRDEIKSALSQDRMVKESRLIEDILGGIAKGSAVVYGIDDCERAAIAGAVSTLLVSDTKLAKARMEKSFRRIDDVMRSVDVAKGEVVIVGQHDAGKKLDGIGGIAALLRYRLS